ncbi:hypothetical protein MUO14_21045 [Halobacillus shinanisalinarum]|uniref:Uncharacterized protein n=1 Tax=Halobacillus shinanisalinarum TaxID=2932258 RepID=A0ABY4GXX6_9BACI|nr:hypothetical protein [Halobacillus shinanisalinarum]UOQ92866.1 hypothetical protein MUO14_21045 [Halobacillus shinanisalinarum]
MVNLFLDQEHEDYFYGLRSKMEQETYKTNKKYLSVIFLMAAEEELYRKANPYFDTTRGVFDSNKMFEEQDFSVGIGLLARLAVLLFDNNESVTLLKLIGTLDEIRFKLALNAIYLRRFGFIEYKEQEEKLKMPRS